eukprot:gene2036-3956_t
MITRLVSPFRSSTKTPDDMSSKFTLIHIKEIHQTLVSNKDISNANYDTAVETLRELAELVVYGDRNNYVIFEYFCEKNMLSLCLDIIRNVGNDYPKMF